MKPCRACIFANAEDGADLCADCQRVVNEIAREKLVNGEPLPDGNTLKQDMTTFLKQNSGGAE